MNNCRETDRTNVQKYRNRTIMLHIDAKTKMTERGVIMVQRQGRLEKYAEDLLT